MAAETRTDDLLQVLSEKKDKLNQQANRQRDLRDKLNDGTKMHANHRDELNAKVRSIVDRANEHKTRRDDLNRQVREAKGRRDELNKVANEKADALNAVKRERAPNAAGGQSLGKLKHELRRLEYEQQTKVMSPKAEKELIDRMVAIQKELATKEKAYEEDDEVREAYDAMRQAKADAEAQHKFVTELANQAQSEHEQMVRLFGEADKYRKEADAAQGEFVKSKTEADKVHHEYIEMVNQIRDIDRVHNSMRFAHRQRRREAGEARADQQAEQLFEKFKSGEKLSTEDLMNLQKGGRI